MSNLLAVLVPWWGGSTEPLMRTISSCRGIADEAIIVHQVLFDDDIAILDALRYTAPLPVKVERVDWNFSVKRGFGELANRHGQSTSKWVMLLGTGETVAEEYQQPIRVRLQQSDLETFYRCNHRNDPNDWCRIYSRGHGVRYGGLIHESTVGGRPGPIIFRMQDTPKEPHHDPFHNDCLKWLKGISYNANYLRVGQLTGWRGSDGTPVPELEGMDDGWRDFVRGARESIEAFCAEHWDLLEAAETGDREKFYEGVRYRMAHGTAPSGVNYAPTGEPHTGNETITLTA